MKFNKYEVGINRGLFLYFDYNGVNVSNFAYVRTKFLFMEREKSAAAV